MIKLIIGFRVVRRVAECRPRYKVKSFSELVRAGRFVQFGLLLAYFKERKKHGRTYQGKPDFLQLRKIEKSQQDIFDGTRREVSW